MLSHWRITNSVLFRTSRGGPRWRGPRGSVLGYCSAADLAVLCIKKQKSRLSVWTVQSCCLLTPTEPRGTFGCNVFHSRWASSSLSRAEGPEAAAASSLRTLHSPMPTIDWPRSFYCVPSLSFPCRTRLNQSHFCSCCRVCNDRFSNPSRCEDGSSSPGIER